MQPEHLYTYTKPPTSRPPNRSAGRLLRPPQPFWNHDLGVNAEDEVVELDVAEQPTQRYAAISPIDTRARLPYQQLDAELEADFEAGTMSTMRLMQLSGILQAVHVPLPETEPTQKLEHGQQFPTQILPNSGAAFYVAPSARPYPRSFTKEQPFSSEELSQISQSLRIVIPAKPQPAWKVFLAQPAVKVILGIGVGALMLLLVSRVVDIPKTITVLRMHLTTTQGIIYALLTTLSFMMAFTIRGTRWSLFLRPITKISVFKVIRIYWVGVFINVLLPVQGGEVAKSLMLRSITNVPVSQSLPTVAMDKALDLMPALFIMAIVAFIPGIHMNITLWLILALVSSVLLGVIFVVGLTAWNRKIAIAFIKTICNFIPKGMGNKIEGFAMGFIDSLLAGVSRPKTFIPAALLTCLAISCDGLFAMFAFWTVGVSNMTFGTAIFGYTVFNMFGILPNPPGQVGSNEFYGTLVFGQLLGFDKQGVLAMFFFSHPLTAVIMALTALVCLSSLGLKLSSALKSPPNDKSNPPNPQANKQSVQKEMVLV